MVKRRDNRGGYREGAGRKGEWKSGKTKAIKLPEKLVDEITAIARALDDGHEVRIVGNDSVTESHSAEFDLVTQSENEIVTESKTVKEAVTILTEALALKPNAGGAIKAKIKEALSLLQGYD